jgi:hypothetical protein
MLTDYLKQMTEMRKAMAPGQALPYVCCEDYVRQNGRAYESAALTADEQAIVFAAISRTGGRFPIKQCYSNSQRVILADFMLSRTEGPLRYVEGYFTSEGLAFPVQHGWITINGKVVDLTARLCEPRKSGRLRDRVFGSFPEGRQYIGVEFPTEYVRKIVLRTHEWRTLIDNWHDNWPLLTGQENPLVAAASKSA